MPAAPILKRRIVLSTNVFVELVIWLLSEPLAGSLHRYKYRLALVCQGQCVLRYDNEAGKGDHLHREATELAYEFVDVDTLVRDFQHEVEQMRKENHRCRH